MLILWRAWRDWWEQEFLPSMGNTANLLFMILPVLGKLCEGQPTVQGKLPRWASYHASFCTGLATAPASYLKCPDSYRAWLVIALV